MPVLLSAALLAAGIIMLGSYGYFAVRAFLDGEDDLAVFVTPHVVVGVILAATGILGLTGVIA